MIGYLENRNKMKKWITKNGTEIYQALKGRSNSFLISKNNKYILIDTGPENSWNSLNKILEDIDKRQKPPLTLVLTHVHYDHVENSSKIKEKFDTKIIVHRSEANFLGKGINSLCLGSFFLTKLLINLFGKKLLSIIKYKPVDYDILVDDKYDLDFLGFNACLIHTPGHSEGSISLIIDNEIAIVGDAMFGVFKHSVFPPFAVNPKKMIESWGKLLETGCTLYLPGHGNGKHRELLQRQYNKYLKKYKLDTL